MKIIKKNGTIVEYNSEKIKTSIENAADEIAPFLNSKEIDLIISECEDTLEKMGRECTSSYEVKEIIYESLISNGYKDIAKSYILSSI